MSPLPRTQDSPARTIGVRLAATVARRDSPGVGVRVAVGGSAVKVADGAGEGVRVALGNGVRVGAGVSLGTAVQVGGGAAQIEVGEGPGVMVGRRVALGTGDRKGVGVTVKSTDGNAGAVRTGRASSLRVLTTRTMITTAAAATSKMSMKLVSPIGASPVRARRHERAGMGGGG